MSSAGVIIVSYGTEVIELGWVPRSTPTVVVCNDGRRPVINGAADVRYLLPGQNIGFGAGVNLAARSMDVERLVVVNPDCQLRPEHWRQFVAASDDEVITVPLDDTKGNATTVVSGYPGPVKALLAAYRARHRLPRLPVPRLRRPTSQSAGCSSLTTHWFSGAAFSLARDRFIAVGGFDDRYFLYWEDVDLSKRLGDHHPTMRVCVADCAPGVHGVGASGADVRRAVELERLLSVWRYAATQRGLCWRLATPLIAHRLLSFGDTTRLRAARAEVAILSLGRQTASGERVRVQSWRQIATAAGVAAEEVQLNRLSPAGTVMTTGRSLTKLVRGGVVPERITWGVGNAVAQIRDTGASTVVCVTCRTYDPRIGATGSQVVLDFVDRLSQSYADRADAPGIPVRLRVLLRGLSLAHRRFESRNHPVARTTAAGLSDANALGAEFVPIVRVPPPVRPPNPTHDLLFVGTLDYLPNTHAVACLGRMWPTFQLQRPDTSVMIAGARPPASVVRLCDVNGWELVDNFQDPEDIYRRARVAIAPLTMASGMQIKVQEAMAYGVPVVTLPPAAAGYPAHIPVVRASDEDDFVRACVTLLEAPDRRAELGVQAREWVSENLHPAMFRSSLAAPPGRSPASMR